LPRLVDVMSADRHLCHNCLVLLNTMAEWRLDSLLDDMRRHNVLDKMDKMDKLDTPDQTLADNIRRILGNT